MCVDVCFCFVLVLVVVLVLVWLCIAILSSSLIFDRDLARDLFDVWCFVNAR